MSKLAFVMTIVKWVDKGIKWFGKLKKRRYEKKVDDAVDKHDVNAVNRMLQIAREKREKRRDSS